MTHLDVISAVVSLFLNLPDGLWILGEIFINQCY